MREQKNGRLMVEGAFYRVDLELTQIPSVAQISRGTMVLHSEPESLVLRGWRVLQDVYRRESGF